MEKRTRSVAEDGNPIVRSFAGKERNRSEGSAEDGRECATKGTTEVGLKSDGMQEEGAEHLHAARAGLGSEDAQEQ